MSTNREPLQQHVTKPAQVKYSKPDVEKRRRARMNASLDELRNLLLSTLKMEGSRHSKLEKADILEMTVEHLRSIQRQRMSALPPSQENLIQRYRQGYNECAAEVTRYLMSCPDMDSAVRLRILAHLEVRCRSTNQLLQLKSEAASKARAHQLPYPLPVSSTHGNHYNSERVSRTTLCSPPNEVKTSDGWQPSSNQRVYGPVNLSFQSSGAFGSPFCDQTSTLIPAFRSSSDTHQSQSQSARHTQPEMQSAKTEVLPWIPMTPPESATTFALTPYGHFSPTGFPKGILQGDEVWRPW